MSQQAELVELIATRRTAMGKKVRQLRREGWVPAVMYGPGFDPVPLQFEARNLQSLLSHTGGSQIINLTIPEEEISWPVLVRDVQYDPIRRDPLHVDFYRVDMTRRLTAEVPLVLVGESPVVKESRGMLLQGASVVEVECLPGSLVDAIEVDVSDLAEVGQTIYVRDLAIPAGMDVLTSPDEMIVHVAPAGTEEVAAEEAGEEAVVSVISEEE